MKKFILAAVSILAFACTGPVGAPGPQGPQGPAGADGDAGVQGPQGPEGSSCSVYPIETPDALAPNGGAYIVCTDGTQTILLNGAPGANGDAGTDGTNGTNGTDGANGDAGATGATGPQGPAGPQTALSVLEAIQPCGPAGIEELLVLANGQLLVVFYTGSNAGFDFLAPGEYQTLGGCIFNFSATSTEGTVSWGAQLNGSAGSVSWTIPSP
jgi:hypothetical protein